MVNKTFLDNSFLVVGNAKNFWQFKDDKYPASFPSVCLLLLPCPICRSFAFDLRPPDRHYKNKFEFGWQYNYDDCCYPLPINHRWNRVANKYPGTVDTIFEVLIIVVVQGKKWTINSWGLPGMEWVAVVVVQDVVFMQCHWQNRIIHCWRDGERETFLFGLLNDSWTGLKAAAAAAGQQVNNYYWEERDPSCQTLQIVWSINNFY